MRGIRCDFLSGRCGGFLSFSVTTLWWIFVSTLNICGFWEGVERSPVGPLNFLRISGFWGKGGEVAVGP